ncbi:exonuclease A [Acinetobacter phage ZZ1]|uniref:Exonuclease A n=3 Tax=Caudoviricetes TaxID=2731619 RepID=A0A410T593_9CAUD|nr:exonuclease A [Acinetobacter phage ZZ1]AFL47611.1 exonuclease A [Acinetobacter phage ZZ1]QAU03910.1 exonuclease A [Acinetobacter phage Henu6]
MSYKDFIIDMETLGSRSDSVVVDISVLVFDSDYTQPVESIDELIKAGRRWKLSIASQKGTRTVSPSTVQWWKDQSAEARKNLAPSAEDMTIEQAIPEILQYLKDQGVKPFKSFGYCRGQSFDFPIFVHMIGEAYKVFETNKLEPVAFWNQRDIRTAIEAYSMTRGMTMTPLRKGRLDGFVAHDSIHDCAKDVIMLKTAQRYAAGLEEVPDPDDTDPSSIKKSKF